MGFKKQIVQAELFRKRYEGERMWIRVEDFPKDLLPTDKVRIEFNEGYYSENNSWDPYTLLIIYRDREETDEEFEKRKKFWEEKRIEGKKRRYEEYLKLKKEFETE